MSTLATPPQDSIADATPLPVAEPGAGGDPMTPAHQAELAEAGREVACIVDALKKGGFHAWTSAVLGAGALVFGAFGDQVALIMGVGLAVVAAVGFAGRNQVRQLRPEGLGLLAWAEVMLLGLVIVYSLWQIRAGLTGQSALAQAMENEPMLAKFGSLAEMEKSITVALYGGLIAISLFFQGRSALFFRRRIRRLRAYLQGTPAWIVDLHRRTIMA
ncbi:MAG: hypothetical protein OER86_06835 [Phycisphaerae bacterium]|nr:hypothetical protein [Phycisphaerae bacterium]